MSHLLHLTGQYSRPNGAGFRSSAGFTLIELMIVVGIVGLLAGIGVPNFVQARKSAQVKICISNLRELDYSKQQWAVESKETDTAVPEEDDIIAYLRSGKMPECPGSGTYRLRRVSRTPVCSLFSEGHTVSDLGDDALPD